jgi:hypothetical protein
VNVVQLEEGRRLAIELKYMEGREQDFQLTTFGKAMLKLLQ